MLHTYIHVQCNIFNSISNVHNICALFDLVHLYCAYEAFQTWFSVLVNTYTSQNSYLLRIGSPNNSSVILLKYKVD